VLPEEKVAGNSFHSVAAAWRALTVKEQQVWKDQADVVNKGDGDVIRKRVVKKGEEGKPAKKPRI
jgi:hypothetical protein